jgi:hypothetical protein
MMKSDLCQLASVLSWFLITGWLVAQDTPGNVTTTGETGSTVTNTPAISKTMIVVPPMLGFQRMEYFPPLEGERPRVLVPDAKKGAKLIAAALNAANIKTVVVSHDEAINQRAAWIQRAKWALQVQICKLSLKLENKNIIYTCEFGVALVDLATAKPVLKKTLSGTFETGKKDRALIPTDVFYKCLGDAVALLINDPEFKGKIAS